MEEQEEWVGRSKGTGLLLGTLSREEDKKLGLELQSNDTVIQKKAFKKWKKYFSQQTSPSINFFDVNNSKFKNIQMQCPVWSHVRKVNPRGVDGAPRIIIFRRGYPYMENGLNGKTLSGLLFICFQKDIENGFEYIKEKIRKQQRVPDTFTQEFHES